MDDVNLPREIKVFGVLVFSVGTVASLTRHLAKEKSIE